jgi:SAM-dependent methyltransferase
MIIKISDDLKEQEIWANGMELCNIMGKDFVNGKRVTYYPPEKKEYVHTFSNPVLMTDNYRIGNLNPTVRDTLFSLFQTKPRIVEYDNVSTFWDNTHVGVWCPSIDTVLFAKALRGFLKKGYDLCSGIEVGCGSGFLTKYVLKKGDDIENFTAVDINQYAIKSVMDNIDDSRLSVHCGDVLEYMNDKKYDLVIANPPYVPRPGSIDDNPYEGVSLMKELIYRRSEYLNEDGFLILNVSSLSWDLVFKEEIDFEVLESVKVPLKVNNILNNKEWLSYLRKIGLEKSLHDGYEYWQEIKVLLFRN